MWNLTFFGHNVITATVADPSVLRAVGGVRRASLGAEEALMRHPGKRLRLIATLAAAVVFEHAGLAVLHRLGGALAAAWQSVCYCKEIREKIR